MCPTMRHAAVRMLTLPATQLARLTIGVAALLWCVLLATGSMDRPIYATMRALMPYGCWIATFAAMATFEFLTLFLKFTSNVVVPTIMGLIAMIWVFVAVSMLVSGSPIAAGAAGEATVALIACWMFLRRALMDEIDG